jgi:hypothetical protein
MLYFMMNKNGINFLFFLKTLKICLLYLNEVFFVN